MRRWNGLITSLVGCLTLAFVIFNSNNNNNNNNKIVFPVPDSSVSSSESGLWKSTELRNRPTKIWSSTQSHRSVTPSLAELGGRRSIPEMSDHILMVTRVPGAGAELLVLLLQRLQGLNSFKHIRLPPGDEDLLTSLQQELLVEDITTIIRREAVPLTFDADQRFLNFSTFGRQAPTFISMVRDPMDPQILRRYKKRDDDMSPRYDGSIAYFCGQDPRCTLENRTWALREAQANVKRWYPVIGLLEHVEVTIKTLEKMFPYFFKGATKVYQNFHVPKDKVKTLRKSKSSGEFEGKLLREELAEEMEFYLWLERRLVYPNPEKD